MSDTTAPTSFETLPLEVLGDIFSYFKKIERQKLRILNYKCNVAVAALFGIHYELTNSNGPNYISNYDDQEIKDVTFNCLTVSLDVNNTKTASFLAGLQTLELRGLIAPYNLVIILANCPSLVTLAFSENKLLKSDSEGFMADFTVEKLNMPNLKTLKIKSKENAFSGLYEIYPPHPAENEYTTIIFQLLKEVFSSQNLVNIEIDHPEVFELLYRIFDSQWAIGVGNERTGLFYDIIRSNRKTLEMLTFSGFLRSDQVRPCRFRIHKLQSNSEENVDWLPQLTEMSADYTGFYDELNEFLLSKVLPNQTQLRSLAVVIDLFEGRNSFLKIEPVASTLQTLSIHYWPVFEDDFQEGEHLEPISGEYFRNCIQLVELSVIKAEFPEDEFSEFADLNLLPPTLRNLRLAVVLVFPNENFQAVSFENLKCLQKLELLAKPWFKLGNTKIREMKMEFLDHLIESMPLLRRLSLSKNEYKIRTTIGRDLVNESIHQTIPEELIADLGKRMDLFIQNSTEAVNLTILQRI